MKPLAALTLAVVASLLACGGGGDNAPSNDTPPETPSNGSTPSPGGETDPDAGAIIGDSPADPAPGQPADPPPDSPVVSPPAPTADAAPLGLYQSYTMEPRTLFNTLCDPSGCYSYPYTLYFYQPINLVFNANGFVHIGESGLADDLACVDGDLPTNPCWAYEIDGDTISYDDQTRDFHFDSAQGRIDIGGYDNPFFYLPPAPRGLKLDALFENTDCELGTCTRSSYWFRPDGTLRYVGSSNTFTAGWGVGVISSNSDEFEGRYLIDGYTLRLIGDDGQSHATFFALDEDRTSFQIGRLDYAVPKD